MKKPVGALGGALMVCAVAGASAQEAASEDSRTQYPAFMANSYFTVTVGGIGYRFTGQQLEPGFQAESIDTPHLAARIDLFGHRFAKHLSAQVTYMRPGRYIKYHGVNGPGTSAETGLAYGGVTVVWDVPLSTRLSAYGEGGVGITSRSGFEVNGTVALKDAHFAAHLLGAGFTYRARPNMDVVLGATYSPGRKAFAQPSTRLITAGIRYHMRPLPTAQVEDNRRSEFAFPANVVRLGYTSNLLGYGVNNFFSRKVPVFWGGKVETRRGFTLDYERNMFHTKKRFAFDLGASASYWRSNGDGEVFGTLSAYPLLRFFLARTVPADLYFCYSLAGPTYISRTIIDGLRTGEHFTFQDFVGVGGYFGRKRRMSAEIGIKHFSNGNIFTRNASVKVPLTLRIGLAF